MQLERRGDDDRAVFVRRSPQPRHLIEHGARLRIDAADTEGYRTAGVLFAERPVQAQRVGVERLIAPVHQSYDEPVAIAKLHVSGTELNEKMRRLPPWDVRLVNLFLSLDEPFY